MKRSAIVIACLLLINSECSAYFEDLIQLTTDSDTSIETGRYKSITVNENANLNVTGGTIGGITCNDNAAATFNGGTIVGGFSEPTGQTYDGLPIYIMMATSGALTLNNNSCATILSGNPNKIICNESSKLDAYAGTFDLSFSGNSLMNIYGGQITFFPRKQSDLDNLISSCTINIVGGDLLGMVMLASDESLNVYGRDFYYDPLGGYYDYPRGGQRVYYGVLTGIWANGTPFSMKVVNQETYDRIFLNEIPEPATLLLLGLGAAFLRRTAKSA